MTHKTALAGLGKPTLCWNELEFYINTFLITFRDRGDCFLGKEDAASFSLPLGPLTPLYLLTGTISNHRNEGQPSKTWALSGWREPAVTSSQPGSQDRRLLKYLRVQRSSCQALVHSGGRGSRGIISLHWFPERTSPPLGPLEPNRLHANQHHRRLFPCIPFLQNSGKEDFLLQGNKRVLRHRPGGRPSPLTFSGPQLLHLINGRTEFTNSPLPN